MTDSKKCSAIASALRLLAYREHFVIELRTKLLKRDFTDVEVESAIVEAQNNGWQCQDRSTECYIRSRVDKGFGPIKIRQELIGKGATPELIRRHLVQGGHDWGILLKKAWQKRFGRRSEEASRDKQLRFLRGRGFAVSEVWQLLS